MEKAALLSSQEHRVEQSVLQAQTGLMLLLMHTGLFTFWEMGQGRPGPFCNKRNPAASCL